MPSNSSKLFIGLLHKTENGEKMTIKICIDPGFCSGAIAVLYDHQPMQVIKMPPTPKDILTFCKEIVPSALIGENPFEQVIAYVEDVGGTRVGNSAKSARTFAVHMGEAA